MGNCSLLKVNGRVVSEGSSGILGTRMLLPMDGPSKNSAWITFGNSLVIIQQYHWSHGVDQVTIGQ